MSLINPADSLERQNEKLLIIADALMKRVEHGTSQSSAPYAQFERAALLEQRVRERTLELEHALDLLHQSNAQLAEANHQTEAARRNLADAIETVSEGFALFDPDDLLVMCNSRFCRDFNGMSGVLIAGLSFASYVQQVSQSKNLELPEGVSAQDWARQRLQHHADPHALFNVALAHDRWLQVSEHRTENGGTVVLQTDVTDLVRVERQERDKLRDKQTRMIRATLDHLNQGVCVFDENAQLVGWNQKVGSLLSIPARHLQLGVSLATLLENLDRDVTFTRGLTRDEFLLWSSAGQPRAPISFEMRHGSQKTLQVFGRTMPDQGFVISVTDVTAERDAAQKLFEINEILERSVVERTLELEDALAAAERANATKSRFVAAASHDLLQPLSAAKLFLSTLSNDVTDPTHGLVLSKAQNALSSAEQIIDALLDISKLDSEKGIELDIRTVDLASIFGPLSDEFDALAQQSGLKFSSVSSGLQVRTDPNYLRRILQNLLSNAVRYTDHGQILFGVRRNGGSARIEVWDTGPGIPVEDQKQIFEEFRRLSSAQKSTEGLGLGLAIVERACTRLGHRLDLWSKPGVGSCFMVNVPIVGQSPEPSPTVEPQPSAGMSLGGIVVLVVDRDIQARRALTVMLETWGVHVIETDTAFDALTLLDDLALTPDILLLEHPFDEARDGGEAQKRLGALPCAVLTSDRSADVLRTCAKHQNTVLQKPLDRRKLREFLETATAQ